MKRLGKIIKGSILTTLFSCIVLPSLAQTEHRCIEHQAQYQTQELNLLQKNNERFNTWRKNTVRGASNEYEIPVVVHVLYRTSAENISDNQIQSQLDVLNEDYNLQSDWQNTVSDFIGIVGDAKITFKLATQDPSGNPTTGINRKQTSKQGFDYTANEAKKTSAGGIDPWDPDHYLNLWCVNDVTFQGIKNAVLGYAQFPGLDPATDGVVIRYEVFGRTGNLIPGYDEGRTGTHEVGHWLGLKHLWGLDAQDGCNPSDDDDISDTPLQAASSAGCPLNQVSCGSKDNVQNFMDYADDACMTMFTLGQVDKMHYILDNVRTNFKAVSDFNHDLAIGSITNLSGLNCGSSISPTISILNKGLQAVQSFDLSISINNSTIYNQTHNSSISSRGSLTINNLNISSPAGNNQNIKITATMANSVTDEDLSNNEFSTTFSLNDGQHLQFQISESSLSNNMNWTIDQSNSTVLSKNDIGKTSSNGFEIQDFCLADDACYDFVITDAFLSDLCSQYSDFNISTQYAAGDQFVFNGTIYEAKQLIWGSSPDLYSHYYNNLGSCPEVDGNDYYTVTNETTNEEIIKVKVSEYTSPESTNFCLAKATTTEKSVSVKLVNVYPNPFENFINLSKSVDQIKVYNTYGKIIKIINNTNQIRISNDLAKGVYYLEIHDALQTQTEIIVKK